MKRVTIAVLAAALFCAGCADEERPAWFRECAAERGLDFVHVRAKETRYWFPEIMGGGVALLDHDGDGDLDVYLVQSGDLAEPSLELGNRLYANDGAAAFTDVTGEAGVGDPGYGMGCTAGDFDGDGATDLYVTNVGPNVLYRNLGNGAFEDVTGEAGVGHPGWSTSCGFLDADLDGDLDLFVVNYLGWSEQMEIACKTALGQDYCSPNNYEAPTRDALYRNDGAGAFTDVSEDWGFGSAFGNGLGVSFGDFDGDRRPDVYVANDMMPNQLWINRGPGSFEDDALLLGCAANMDGESEAGMGTVAFDLEDDGDLDLFLTHLREETNTLYVNTGGVFADRTAALGLASPSLRYTGFGVGLVDFDLDGSLDLYVANGAVTKNRPAFDPEDPYAEPDQLFRGIGAGRFEEVSPAGGLAGAAIEASRGAAFGDLDGDGDVDVVVVDSGSRVRLLENVVERRGHWLGLSVLGENGSDAIGATVRIELGGETRFRSVWPATSYCSSNDPRVFCGLGDHPAPVEVTVLWPDGSEERFGPLEVDRLHELRRGS